MINLAKYWLSNYRNILSYINTVVAIQTGDFVKEKKERDRKLNHYNEEKDDDTNVCVQGGREGIRWGNVWNVPKLMLEYKTYFNCRVLKR